MKGLGITQITVEPFFGLKATSETIYRALASLAEGMGIRATARVFQVKKDTVLLWLRRAGNHSAQVSAYLMRNLEIEQAQLDELWTFVFKKEKTLSHWEKLHSEYGDTWVWTDVDPIHQLALAFHVGEHGEEQAESILKKLKAVLACGCLPLLTSDQLPHYVQAILKVFGRWVQPERKGLRGRFPNSPKGNGSYKKWEHRTPAMSACLTDHIWSMKELLTFRVPEVRSVST